MAGNKNQIWKKKYFPGICVYNLRYIILESNG